MAMTQRILVVFPDEWDRAAARDPRFRGRFEFVFEGFDLFSFPDYARLFTFDPLAFVERVASRHARAGIAAVVTSDEQFGPFLASLVAQRLGLPPTPPPAVLPIQHQHHAPEAFPPTPPP